jgi:hypothetical protein
MRLQRPRSILGSRRRIAMPATSSSLVHRFGSDATMYAGPGEIRRDYVDKMLLAVRHDEGSNVVCRRPPPIHS